MQRISIARGAKTAVLGIVLAMAALAQEQPAPPQAQIPAPAETKPPVTNLPNVPLGPPPSTKTTYANDVVIEARYWLTKAEPAARFFGADATNQFSFKNDIGGNNNHSRPMILVGIPTGHGNRVWFSYAETTFNGGGFNPRALTFAGQAYDPQTLLYAQVKVRNFKLSWDYLTYPAPPHAMRKWQFKTLWEVQGVNMEPLISSTILSEDSTGLITDSGNTTNKSKFMILPTIGAGFDTQPVKNVNFSVKGSGMLFPSHKFIYDAEAKLGVRVIKHLEAVLGYRLFYASLGSKTEQYYRTNMTGPFGGLAWHF
ncbi:MAG: hypothetical protein ABI693_04015 [Bryobacteraceae bacterium]